MMSGLNFYQGSQQMPVLHAMQLPDPLSHKVKILVGNFPRSDWIRRDQEYLSVFSPNAEKYGRE